MNKRGWQKGKKRGKMPDEQKEKIRATLSSISIKTAIADGYQAVYGAELSSEQETAAIRAMIKETPKRETIEKTKVDPPEKIKIRQHGKKFIQDKFGQYDIFNASNKKE